ncbi:nuclear transport factor 2 family protein [Streptomyces sp. GESEQ-4]|uniref:nuclear transport factor 2 family protein n=1 Tax=Streptomyces sp. GESEQ-4 TaxID=2812655 RepID=UPI001B3440C5|nr:nuclear transport factor 2 family protein [Streptomyces sp. GESEQ-4]
MKLSSAGPASPSRRTLLGGMVAATAVTGLAAGSVAATTNTHSLRSRTVQVMGHDVDVSRATPWLADFFASYFEAKSGTDVDRLMTHFSRESIVYTDATVGWAFPNWQSLYDLFASLLPTWPESAMAYPTRIVGDDSSAVVFFTDSPELFGRELRAIGTINFRQGKVARWVDHWDGRSLTVKGVADMRVPADQFPTDFGEETVGETAAPALRTVVRKLVAALAAGDAARAASLLDPDVVVEDIALHTQVVGRGRVQEFLGRTLPILPYGHGVTLRHVVGCARGGAFEWVGRAPLLLGVTALELSQDGLISRMTSTWDSALWQETTIGQVQGATILG